MKGMGVIQGFCKYSAAAMWRNNKFQIRDNEFAEKGVIERVALWINCVCVAQAWETDLEKLRKIAKKYRTRYAVRDMRGKVVERGDYSREGGKDGQQISNT